MVSFPNAKINIGLNIIQKRSDGFHDIESCFLPVSCCDVLELLPASNTNFKTTGITIPGDSTNNLCLKAFELLKADFDIPNYAIHLHKAVPIGAGMGGGSADGAFVLKMINELAALQLTTSQLEIYARKMGSDCAFFIDNKPKYCFGKGDEFEEIDLNISGKYIVLVNPNIHISTAEAYAGVIPQKSDECLKNLLKLPIYDWKNNVKNDFEANLFPKYPILKKIKQDLYNLGANYASLTGSGSTLYGIFDALPSTKLFSDYWVFETSIC
jgi:4-diphosphocytidyl-2-C-methyl-D-erythritol kinase